MHPYERPQPPLAPSSTPGAMIAVGWMPRGLKSGESFNKKSTTVVKPSDGLSTLIKVFPGQEICRGTRMQHPSRYSRSKGSYFGLAQKRQLILFCFTLMPENPLKTSSSAVPHHLTLDQLGDLGHAHLHQGHDYFLTVSFKVFITSSVILYWGSPIDHDTVIQDIGVAISFSYSTCDILDLS